MEKFAVMFVGVSGSGKTTMAKSLVKTDSRCVIVSRDDIRMAQGFPALGSKEQEEVVTKIQRSMIDSLLLDGMIPLIADTNINPQIRNSLVKFLHQRQADVQIILVETDLDTCIERNANRPNPVPEHVIRKQHDKLSKQEVKTDNLKYRRFAPYKHKHSLEDNRPSIVVVDIDGTLADHNGRSPFDESKVYMDKPISDVVQIVEDLDYAENQIVYVSGRSEDCRVETERWLRTHVDAKGPLYMRKSGDTRPDWEIKNEIYDEHLIPNYNIQCALDDRDQVVNHVRSRGITVLQVAPGRF